MSTTGRRVGGVCVWCCGGRSLIPTSWPDFVESGRLGGRNENKDSVGRKAWKHEGAQRT